MPDNLPPSPAEIESVAEEMIALKGKVSDIQAKAQTDCEPHIKRLGELKDLAETWLRKFGSAHAEKSKLLHGLAYEIMGTFGMSTSVDAAAVEVFRLALVKAKQARLLSRLFIKTIRFDLNPGSSEIVKGAKLKGRLASLYAKCWQLSPKTPVITPREKKKEAGAAA